MYPFHGLTIAMRNIELQSILTTSEGDNKTLDSMKWNTHTHKSVWTINWKKKNYRVFSCPCYGWAEKKCFFFSRNRMRRTRRDETADIIQRRHVFPRNYLPAISAFNIENTHIQCSVLQRHSHAHTKFNHNNKYWIPFATQHDNKLRTVAIEVLDAKSTHEMLICAQTHVLICHRRVLAPTNYLFRNE